MRSDLVGLSLVVGLLGGGCTATCEEVCNKLSSCGDDVYIGTSNTLDCTASCLSQEQEADDREREAEFDQLKNCIASETCELLQTDVCYDESLYSW